MCSRISYAGKKNPKSLLTPELDHMGIYRGRMTSNSASSQHCIAFAACLRVVLVLDGERKEKKAKQKPWVPKPDRRSRKKKSQ